MVQKLSEIKKFLTALLTAIASLVASGVLSAHLGALATGLITGAVGLIGAVLVYLVPNADPIDADTGTAVAVEPEVDDDEDFSGDNFDDTSAASQQANSATSAVEVDAAPPHMLGT